MTKDTDQAWRDYLWGDTSVLALVLDAGGTIAEANPRARALLGEAVVGRQAQSLLTHGNAIPDEGLVHLALAGDRLESLRVRRVPLPEGELLLGEVDGAESAALHREVASLNDELQNLTRELARKNEELRRLDALKNRFLGMAAHDLRKPAGAVRTYAEFLIEEAAPKLDEEHRRFLETIRRSADSMARLIDDFLDLAVIESGKLTLARRPVDPGAIVTAGMAVAGVQARLKGVACEVDAPSLPALTADAAKLEQVVVNLVGNAIEHSPKGATVRVASRLEQGEWVLCVSDQGAGLEPQEMERLFRPYETGQAKTAGERSTGLGLAICKMIVDAHGGTLRVASAKGAGATFTVRIPTATGGRTP